MKKAKLLILYSRNDRHLKGPKFSSGYRGCYDYLASLAESNSLNVYKSSLIYFDQKIRRFNFGWKFCSGSWKKVKTFKIDVIYYKDTYTSAGLNLLGELEKLYPTINNSDFNRILENKFLAYTFFPNFISNSFLVRNNIEIKRNINGVRSDRVVFKPLLGTGGFGIKILDRPKAKKFNPKVPMVMQEFIDTSKGYRKFVSGVHDLRVFMINEKITYAYFRVSKKGSLLSNIHQGGKMINIKNNQIPKSVKKIISQVNHKLKPFGPKIFSIDFFFNKKGKPYIVEFNTRPGIYFYPEDKKLQTKVYLKMIKLFKEVALRNKTK